MKRIYVLLCIACFYLTCLYCNGQEEKELNARNIRIITDSAQTIQTNRIVLGDSALTYIVNEKDEILKYTDIDYIYLKEGSSFPKVMLYCVLLGLGYGVIYGVFSVTGTFIGNVAIGLAGGVIAGLIVAPFVRKPDKLIFYKGKWTDSKYTS